MSEYKSRIININKTFQLLEVTLEMRKFITKDNKSIVYYPFKVIYANNKIFTDMINKKKEYLFWSTSDQNEYEEIEFAYSFWDWYWFRNEFQDQFQNEFQDQFQNEFQHEF
jgi:hypothetical protein